MRVTVLLGGTSGEREVSLASGAACAGALRAEGYEVAEVDTQDADFVSQIVESEPDVVFIALHGVGGEDGTIQGLLELLGLPYTGPGVLASALAMDKERAKVFYRDAGVTTPPSLAVERGGEMPTDDELSALGERIVVKPACEGSALGVRIVSAGEATDAVRGELETYERVIVERCIEGTEATVAVLGGAEPVALPVIEIVPWAQSEFYDYEAKYAPGGSTHVIPGRFSEAVTARCQELALAAHRSLGCWGVSRSDMIVDETGEVWVLETNTVPGMTETSLLPDAAAKAGISFGELCRRLVELALER